MVSATEAVTSKQSEQPEQSMESTKPLTLRTVARKLAFLRMADTVSKTIAYDVLLGELQDNGIVAVIKIVHSAGWIEVPADYWLKVSLARFKKLVRKESESLSGSFGLKPFELPDFFAQFIIAQLKNDEGRAEDALKSLLSRRLRFEPVILQNEWLRYLDKNKFPNPPARISEGAGKEVWFDIGTCWAGYLLAHDIKAKNRFDEEQLFENMRRKAVKLGVDVRSWLLFHRAGRDFLKKAQSFADRVIADGLDELPTSKK